VTVSVSRVPMDHSLFKLLHVTEVNVATGNGLDGLDVVTIKPVPELSDIDSSLLVELIK
jgi:hypothetical protein